MARVVVRVSAHITDSDRETVTHANNAQLRDRVLLEVLCDELLSIS